MKKIIRIIVTIALAVFVAASVIWYLFDYDRDFTRDMLLREARLNDLRGNTGLSAWFYNLAYSHSGNDEDVAIELANQYKGDGNYTKAEVTLTNAINASPSANLYTALCRAFVEQDKLMDAVALLASIPDETIRAQLDAKRPSAPTSSMSPGLYSQYISVDLNSSSGTILYSTDGEYPSTANIPYSAPITLEAGETIIRAISIDNSGLVSPVSLLSYTVGGVVEPAVFASWEIESAVRTMLNKSSSETIYTNDLWTITDFTVPADAWTLEDLPLFTHLQSLTIHGLQLPSLEDLRSLSELEKLDLEGCRFNASELAILAELPALKELNISNCGLSTIADLAGVTTLTVLNFSSNTIRNLEPLSGMTELQQLYMQHNALTDLDVLSNMYNLQKLDVSYNSLTTLVPLATCARLEWLDASTNQLTNVNGLTNLQLLTSLSLDFNQLTDVSPLGGSIQLKELSISNNSIYDIALLSSLCNLEAFDFSYNSITSLPTFGSSAALRILQGSYNRIDSINSLRGMSHLTYVSMDYNSLTDVSALADCVNLVQVNVYGNKISDVTALTDHNIIVNFDPT